MSLNTVTLRIPCIQWGRLLNHGGGEKRKKKKRIVRYLLKDWEETVFWGVNLNWIQWKAAFLWRGAAGEECWIWVFLLLCALITEKWMHSLSLLFFFFDIGALCCGCVCSCKAHIIISPPKSVFLLGAAPLKGVRLSLQSEWESLGLGSSVGREQQFRKKQMHPVAPVLGWCWADAELR